MCKNMQTHRNDAFGEEYVEFIHPSGVLVFVYQKSFVSTYAMFTTRYGSFHNTFRLADGEWARVPDGVAHFLEHKLFEDESGEDTFEKFTALGASANAFTANEMTSYLFSSSGAVLDALHLLLSFVMKPYFTDENVKKERGIIEQEIEMYQDRPASRLYHAVLEGLYQKHNLRIDIAGTKESIAEITPETLYSCYNTFYHPSNMILTVVGNLTPQEVYDALDDVLGSEVREAQRIECREQSEPLAPNAAYTSFSMEISKPMLAIAAKDRSVFATAHERLRHGYAVTILLRLLFGRSSPFYNSLYERSMISQSFTGYYEWFNTCAYWCIEGESDDVDAVFSEIESFLSRISEEIPFTEEDFLRVKRAFYAEAVRILESAEALAYELTDTKIHGVTLWEVWDAIREVSYKDILQLKEEFFKLQESVRVVILPTEKQ